MARDTFQEKIRNFVVVLLLLIVTLVCIVQEGYLKRDAPQGFSLTPGSDGYLFWLTLVAGFLFAFWLAQSISTRRLVSIVLSTMIVQYFGQTVGTKLGLWTYPISNESYFFGILLWVIAVLFAYTGATKTVVKLCMMSRFKLPSTLNPLILLVLLAVIWFTGPKILQGTSTVPSEPLKSPCLFWAYLAVHGVIGTIAALRNDFRVVTGIVITAWIVGLICESSGASAGIWRFGESEIPTCPPVYLVIGCRPIEILAIFALSAFLAGEPLIPSASPPTQGIQPDELCPSTLHSMSSGAMDAGNLSVKPDTAGSKGMEDVPGKKEHADEIYSVPRTSPSMGERSSTVLLTDEERVLKVFLQIGALVYLVVGIIFVLKPEFVIRVLEAIGTWNRTDVPHGVQTVDPREARFWVTMTFSMTMTIAFLAFYAQRNIRKNKLYVIPLLIAKGSSASSAFRKSSVNGGRCTGVHFFLAIGGEID